MSLITDHTYSTASLDTWQDGFWALYGTNDKDLPLYDITLQLTTDSTRIAEAIRRGQYHVALPYIPSVFSWLCTLTAKCARDQGQFADISSGRPLSSIIWDKYPGLCAFRAESTCNCPALHVDSLSPEERARFLAVRAGRLEQARQHNPKPRSLDDWVFMFERIYGPVNAARSSAEKTFHFLEEVGELETEHRKADKLLAGIPIEGQVQWEAEVADVFSWLTAVYLHIKGFAEDLDKLLASFQAKHVPGFEDAGRVRAERLLSFSAWIWHKFGGTDGLICHRCRLTVCDCRFPARR